MGECFYYESVHVSYVCLYGNITCLAACRFLCLRLFMVMARYTEMDVGLTFDRAEAELRETSGEWRKIGSELSLRVHDLLVIGANCGDKKICLSEMLSSWFENERNPSWNKLCNALHRAGLYSKAEQLRKKYCRGELGRILHYNHVKCE